MISSCLAQDLVIRLLVHVLPVDAHTVCTSVSLPDPLSYALRFLAASPRSYADSYRNIVDPSQSNTAQLLNGESVPFNFSYGSGDVVGDYITDNIAFGGASLTDVIIGVATQNTNEQWGILGVGLPADEAPDIPEHPGVLELLVSQGYISSTSYSLYLDGYSKPSADSPSFDL